MNRLSSITQFKIEFLLPLTSCRKVLGKMPGTQFKMSFYYRLPVVEKCLEKCLISFLRPIMYFLLSTEFKRVRCHAVDLLAIFSGLYSVRF